MFSISAFNIQAIHLGSIGHKHFPPDGWLHHNECGFVQPQRATRPPSQYDTTSQRSVQTLSGACGARHHEWSAKHRFSAVPIAWMLGARRPLRSHWRASFRYSSRRRGSTVNLAARRQSTRGSHTVSLVPSRLHTRAHVKGSPGCTDVGPGWLGRGNGRHEAFRSIQNVGDRTE